MLPITAKEKKDDKQDTTIYSLNVRKGAVLNGYWEFPSVLSSKRNLEREQERGWGVPQRPPRLAPQGVLPRSRPYPGAAPPCFMV